MNELLAKSLPNGEISLYSETSKKQLVIFPEADRDGTRLILVGIGQDMLSKTIEEIRLDYKAFPAIALLKHDGKISVDILYCLQQGIYDNPYDLLLDLKLLLDTNDIPQENLIQIK